MAVDVAPAGNVRMGKIHETRCELRTTSKESRPPRSLRNLVEPLPFTVPPPTKPITVSANDSQPAASSKDDKFKAKISSVEHLHIRPQPIAWTRRSGRE